MNLTSGRGVMSHLFKDYEPYCGEFNTRRVIEPARRQMQHVGRSTERLDRCVFAEYEFGLWQDMQDYKCWMIAKLMDAMNSDVSRGSLCAMTSRQT